MIEFLIITGLVGLGLLVALAATQTFYRWKVRRMVWNYVNGEWVSKRHHHEQTQDDEWSAY